MKSEQEVSKRLNDARLKSARLGSTIPTVLKTDALKSVKQEIKILEWVMDTPTK